jgi:hypothetical protein
VPGCLRAVGPTEVPTRPAPPRPSGSRAAATNALGDRAPRPVPPYPGPGLSLRLAGPTPARRPLAAGPQRPRQFGISRTLLPERRERLTIGGWVSLPGKKRSCDWSSERNWAEPNPVTPLPEELPPEVPSRGERERSVVPVLWAFAQTEACSQLELLKALGLGKARPRL